MRLYGDAGVAIATGVLTFVVSFAEVLLQKLSPRSIRKSGSSPAASLAPLQIPLDDAAGVGSHLTPSPAR